MSYAHNLVTKLYLVMEYCKGGELFDHLVEKGPYTEKTVVNQSAKHASKLLHPVNRQSIDLQASKLCKQLASVIKFMHSHGVVHRYVTLRPDACSRSRRHSYT